MRGASAIVTNVRWDAVDARSRLASVAYAYGEIVRVRRPGAGVKFRGSESFRKRWWQQSRSPGRPCISRKATAQGRPDASAKPVCSCAHYDASIARETAGAARTRSSLRPLSLGGPRFPAKLRAPRAARTRSHVDYRAATLPGAFFAGVSLPASAITETETTRSMIPWTSLRSHCPSDNFVSRSFSRMV